MHLCKAGILRAAFSWLAVLCHGMKQVLFSAAILILAFGTRDALPADSSTHEPPSRLHAAGFLPGSGNAGTVDPSLPFAPPGPAFSLRSAAREESAPIRLSIDFDSSVTIPISDQFQAGIQARLAANVEWHGTAAIFLEGGVGHHEVLDRRGNLLVSGDAWLFPLTAGAALFLDLSKQHPIRLRFEARGGWYFARNSIKQSTLDSLEFQGFPDHSETIGDSIGLEAGLRLEWGGKGPIFFNIQILYRYLHPVAEFENPIHDPISGFSQPDSAVMNMDAVVVGVGGGLHF